METLLLLCISGWNAGHIIWNESRSNPRSVLVAVCRKVKGGCANSSGGTPLCRFRTTPVRLVMMCCWTQLFCRPVGQFIDHAVMVPRPPRPTSAAGCSATPQMISASHSASAIARRDDRGNATASKRS